MNVTPTPTMSGWILSHWANQYHSPAVRVTQNPVWLALQHVCIAHSVSPRLFTFKGEVSPICMLSDTKRRFYCLNVPHACWGFGSESPISWLCAVQLLWSEVVLFFFCTQHGLFFCFPTSQRNSHHVVLALQNKSCQSELTKKREKKTKEKSFVVWGDWNVLHCWCSWRDSMSKNLVVHKVKVKFVFLILFM